VISMDPQLEDDTIVAGAEVVTLNPEPELAWSTEQHPEIEQYSWPVAIRIAVGITAITAGVAVYLLSLHGDDRGATLSSTPQASTTQVVATPLPALPTQELLADQSVVQPERYADHTFLAMLRSGGTLIGDPADVISYGHAICQNRSDGILTEDETIDMVFKYNPQLGRQGSGAEVIAAETVYCPAYVQSRS
jgi:Protein of unknown function (DUF732)